MVKQKMKWSVPSPISVFMVTGCYGQNQSRHSQVTLSAEISADPDPIPGKSIYASKCSIYHGKGGTGSSQGPPLAHKIYEPGHHADYSFYRAVTSGVRSHHWRFGNMPAIPGISPEEAGHIIAYIRPEQCRAGIK